MHGKLFVNQIGDFLIEVFSQISLRGIIFKGTDTGMRSAGLVEIGFSMIALSRWWGIIISS